MEYLFAREVSINSTIAKNFTFCLSKTESSVEQSIGHDVGVVEAAFGLVFNVK